MDTARLAKAYIAIRDKKSELKKLFDAEYSALGEKMTRLEGEMLREMQNNNCDKIGTEFGTIYRQEDLKPSVADWSTLDEWIEANPDVGPSDVLEKRISKTFVKQYMDDHEGKLPPGVNVYREFVARVRRS